LLSHRYHQWPPLALRDRHGANLCLKQSILDCGDRSIVGSQGPSILGFAPDGIVVGGLLATPVGGQGRDGTRGKVSMPPGTTQSTQGGSAHSHVYTVVDVRQPILQQPVEQLSKHANPVRSKGHMHCSGCEVGSHLRVPVGRDTFRQVAWDVGHRLETTRNDDILVAEGDRL
jgi:hypothetical protein